MKLPLSLPNNLPQASFLQASPSTNRWFIPTSTQLHVKQTFNLQHGAPPSVSGAPNAKLGADHSSLPHITTTTTRSNSIMNLSLVAGSATGDMMELFLH